MELQTCCICKKPLDDKESTAILTDKGKETINRFSEMYAEGNVQAEAGQSVHVNCRKYFCRIRKSASTTVGDSEPQTSMVSSSRRSLSSKFTSKEHCFLCGTPAKYGGKKKGFEVIPVRTDDLRTSMLKTCENRNDSWAETVQGRIEYLVDLHAADACYHQACSINFRTGKQIPTEYQEEFYDGPDAKRPRQGRPVDSTRLDAFLNTTKYLIENDEEQISIGDLVKKMKEWLPENEEPYSARYMKKKLLEHFGDAIFITNLTNQENIVTFKKNASSIIKEFYNEPKQDIELEKQKIIRAAANLIKSEIKNIEVSDEYYPSNEEMSSTEKALDFVPNLLQTLLRNILVGKDIELKLASISQSIIQACRPRRILSPLQLGLAVQLHHHFASRHLIDTLNAHGFCTSYSTVQKYTRSATIVQGTDIQDYDDDQFVQHMADNLDHNIRTLDGKGTFHGMGIIATITPGRFGYRQQSIPKREVSNEEILNAGKIEIQSYGPVEAPNKILYKEIADLKVVDHLRNLDLLWKLSLPILKTPRYGWSGTMQTVCEGTHPGKSTILFLPMIDMDPSDESCIYSTLKFVSTQAKRYKFTPVITFDQPLYWKALNIVSNDPQESDLKSIVVRLGGLHMQMSFLGSIGKLMAGSGLEEVLETVYANNAVTHMMSGKAIARAIRGHFLVDTALHSLMIKDAFNIELDIEDPIEDPSEEEEATTISDENAQHNITSYQELEEAGALFAKLVNEEATPEDVCSATVLKKLEKKLEEWKSSLKKSRTAVLWMEYMKMVDILRTFIKAERTGNWKLHLQAAYDMLPYFAAAGHNLYTKSTHVYLQQMQALSKDHPDMHTSFENGLHVVRRTDRYWAGLSTDLIIEQVLMRSVKTTGGLTRGRGMTEIQRLVWLLSMPVCAEVNNAMQTIAKVNYHTSDQHKETTQARQNRDYKDTKEILTFLAHRNPFSSRQGESLRSIVSGVVAGPNVNVDKANEIGKAIIKALPGQNTETHVFKKKDQATTLASKTSVKIGDDTIQVDPGLLFQRLSIVATCGQYENPSEFFKFEMSSFPPALFDKSLLPRKANKPVLADAIWSSSDNSQASITGDPYFVLDGGALLHRIPWSANVSFGDLCSQYVQYVKRRYKRATIVFDGYASGPSTKDCTHQRRTTVNGPDVNFNQDTILKLKKDSFLSNPSNKQKFVNLLGEKLQHAGYKVYHSKGDADLPIVLNAVQSAESDTTVLIGDDTDLLVLLCFYADENAHDLFFHPEAKKKSKSRRIWDIKSTKSSLGSDICDNLLFVHAILGCDTTSGIYGLGKGAALKAIANNTTFKEQAIVFNDKESTKDDIIRAGEIALMCLYNGKHERNLDSLRYAKFCRKAATGTAFVMPETLPPTSAAAKYHSLRVFHQVQYWKGNVLPPEEWGWKLCDGHFQAARTDLPPAHASILELIRCNCKTDCSTKRCTCQKNGLPCSSACGVCQGYSCNNASQPDFDMNDSD